MMLQKYVIPVKTGIQRLRTVPLPMDSHFRENDE